METTHKHLISCGIHPSVHRIALMKYLEGHRTHPTVDKIFEDLHPALPTLSKTTIYNTLKLFAEKGAIQIITIDAKNARFDADTKTHAHFQCSRCGMVFDVPIMAFPQVSEQDMADFDIQDTQVYFRGICPKCKNECEKSAVSGHERTLKQN